MYQNFFMYSFVDEYFELFLNFGCYQKELLWVFMNKSLYEHVLLFLFGK